MKKYLMAGVLALVALAGCVQHSQPALAPLDLVAKADSSAADLSAFGTLAPTGSFEALAAPVYTHVMADAHIAQNKLAKGELSVKDAQAIHDVGVVVLGDLNAAVSACYQSDKTGKCDGDDAKAHEFLARAIDAAKSLP